MSLITFGKLCFLINILTVCAAVAQAEENETGAVMTKLCNFNNTLIDPPDEVGGKYCDCDVENSPPWGIAVVVINCQDHHLQNDIFQGETLPQGTIRLDLSYNKFSSIPNFSGDKLEYLSLRNNNITALADKNFVNISYLMELDLSENGIELINSDAFVGLKILRYLNLAENQIKLIHPNAFSPIIHLEHLVLSHNPLGDFFNNSENDIFLKLGVTPRLNMIELENCSLVQIDLSNGVGLDHIILTSNQLTTIQKLPRALSHLDISDNPIRLMSAKCLPHLSNLQSLTMEDMPYLYRLDEYALFGLPRLTHLNLQGSRNLTTIDPHVFGKNVVLNETDTVLENLILKGTNIRTLNSSLQFAFEQLKTLDLTGTPFNCDCQVQWLKKMNFTTLATCAKPASLRGTDLSKIDFDKLQCKVEKSWIYTVFNVLLVIFLVICVGAVVYLVYRVIRPRQKVQMRKMGVNSPYARVTIEPNQAEHL